MLPAVAESSDEEGSMVGSWLVYVIFFTCSWIYKSGEITLLSLLHDEYGKKNICYDAIINFVINVLMALHTGINMKSIIVMKQLFKSPTRDMKEKW